MVELARASVDARRVFVRSESPCADSPSRAAPAQEAQTAGQQRWRAEAQGACLEKESDLLAAQAREAEQAAALAAARAEAAAAARAQAKLQRALARARERERARAAKLVLLDEVGFALIRLHTAGATAALAPQGPGAERPAGGAGGALPDADELDARLDRYRPAPGARGGRARAVRAAARSGAAAALTGRRRALAGWSQPRARRSTASRRAGRHGQWLWWARSEGRRRGEALGERGRALPGAS